MNKDIFVKITNEEIFRKIINIENKLDTDIAARIARIEKKVSIATWTSATALTVCILLIGAMVT